MRERFETADRLAAEALIDGTDGYDGLDLLPALCHRGHMEACRSAVLRRAELYMTRPPVVRRA